MEPGLPGSRAPTKSPTADVLGMSEGVKALSPVGRKKE